MAEMLSCRRKADHGLCLAGVVEIVCALERSGSSSTGPSCCWSRFSTVDETDAKFSHDLLTSAPSAYELSVYEHLSCQSDS